MFGIKIWTFSFQNSFQNQFWTSGSGQTENMQIRICAYLLLLVINSEEEEKYGVIIFV